MVSQAVKKFFDDSVQGGHLLTRVFWLEGVLVSQGLFLCLLGVYQYSSPLVLVMSVVVFMAYTAWILRRIWLNAANVQHAEWGQMARVLTVGWAINSATVCLFLTLAKLGHQPLQILH